MLYFHMETGFIQCLDQLGRVEVAGHFGRCNFRLGIVPCHSLDILDRLTERDDATST